MDNVFDYFIDFLITYFLYLKLYIILKYTIKFKKIHFYVQNIYNKKIKFITFIFLWQYNKYIE